MKEESNFKGIEDDLLQELEDFKRDKERIRKIIGNIGGKAYSKLDMTINIVFLGIILVIFLLEMTIHLLPAFTSLEIGVLLVSIKIAFMIHSQQRFNHFQFWILSSMEFKINEIDKKVKQIEKRTREEKIINK
ncbi:hypothetical protein [Haliovirga abyssi]|uniref:DUF1003 domain-containing protein n=1 Tax=Haliovirga abyssi TaxID=2996794 RepID=A0AAU9DWI4_9FUSO|nr:hypothetical protein [Haliovirga abyssi]BDU49610.1 hypothetical protein HLVA_01790 [Haliovirga abyssi]